MTPEPYLTRPYLLRTNYEVAISALKMCCINVAASHGIALDKGAAIAFYRYEEERDAIENGSMKMRIWPLDEKYIDAFFPNDEHIQKTILTAINEKRKYSKLDHLKHFESFHNCGLLDQENHFHITFSDEDVVHHDRDADTVILNGISYTWQEVADKLNDPSDGQDFYDKNIKALDHLLFASGMKKALVIPVPILTSPAVLFFLHHDIFEKANQKIAKFVVELIKTATEVIHFYLYNRILFEFSKKINLLEIRTEPELFNEYARNLVNILLPIDYKTDGMSESAACFRWFGDCSQGCLNTFSVHFSEIAESSESAATKKLYEHHIELTLPDFKTPYFRNNNEHQEDIYLKDWNEYDLRVQRVQTTLNNIYRLVFNNWQALQEQKTFVGNKIETLITELRDKKTVFQQMQHDVQNTNDLMSSLLDMAGRLQQGNLPHLYEFYRTRSDSWNITFEGERLNKRDYDGFPILFRILSNEGRRLRWSDFPEYQQNLSKQYNKKKADKKPGKNDRAVAAINFKDNANSALQIIKHDLVMQIIRNKMEESGNKDKNVLGPAVENVWAIIKEKKMENFQILLEQFSTSKEFISKLLYAKKYMDVCFSITNKYALFGDEDYKACQHFMGFVRGFFKKTNPTLLEDTVHEIKHELRGQIPTETGKQTMENAAVQATRANLENAIRKLCSNHLKGNAFREHLEAAGLLVDDPLELYKVRKSSGATKSADQGTIMYKQPVENRIKWRFTEQSTYHSI